jgi:hypothetical protein
VIPMCQFERLPDLLTDGEFIDMLDAYRAIGGISRAEHLPREAAGSPRAQHLHATEIEPLSISWGGTLWYPVFQFDWPGLSLAPGVSEVLCELRPILDACQTAQWFCKPNAWLRGAVPAEQIRSDATAVLNAARADRFIVAG